ARRRGRAPGRPAAERRLRRPEPSRRPGGEAMKTTGGAILFVVLTVAGCDPLPVRTEAPPPPPPSAPVAAARPVVRKPAPVTAARVHDDNAHEVVSALAEELDRDEAEALQPELEPAPRAGKP